MIIKGLTIIIVIYIMTINAIIIIIIITIIIITILKAGEAAPSSFLFRNRGLDGQGLRKLHKMVGT